MEIIKELLSDRIDYIQALRGAPAPLPKVKGLGTPNPGPSIPMPTAPTPSASPQVPQTASVQTATNPEVASSGKLWKALLILGAIGLGVYLIHRSYKKRKEESR
jgi:hypothetical protein